MIIDIHAHMLNKNFDINKFKPNFTTWMFAKRLDIKNFDDYFYKIKTSLNKSPVEKAVLCALENTSLCSDNKQTSEICKSNKEFLFGANLNPLDKNCLEKLDNAIKNNAVLVKILPSYQNVDLSDERCIPFFEMMRENNIPILCHTGIEHSIKSKGQELNDPKKLKLALKIGVKVIAAHLGCKLNFWEKDYFQDWCKMALEYENFYGDLSAMIWFYRKNYLKFLLKHENLQEKLVFGGDFPCYPYINLDKENNIFSDWYYFFKKLNFNDIIFTNWEKLIAIKE